MRCVIPPPFIDVRGDHFGVPATCRPDFDHMHIFGQAEELQSFLWMPVVIA